MCKWGHARGEHAGHTDNMSYESLAEFVDIVGKLGSVRPEARDRPRPQTPVPPFPYETEEVIFHNDAGDQFAGTLTLPSSGGPFPAVSLISGAGPQDRDETMGEHKPFMVIADYLTRRGIAVLRVDDRDVGGSHGLQRGATTGDFADDAVAAIEFLESRDDIDMHRIGLIGHSEGGMIAPLAARRSGHVAFIVMLAGPGLPGAEIAVLQTRELQKAAGAPPQVVDFNVALQRRAIEIMIRNFDEETMRTEVDAAIVSALQSVGRDDADTLKRTRAVMADEMAKALDPWTRFSMEHDPRSVLAQLTMPILALNGDKDVQVPAAENLAAIAETFEQSGNAKGRTVVLPGLNHLFQTATTGAPSEYVDIEETFAPAALEIIGDWIVEQTQQS